MYKEDTHSVCQWQSEEEEWPKKNCEAHEDANSNNRYDRIALQKIHHCIYFFSETCLYDYMIRKEFDQVSGWFSLAFSGFQLWNANPVR